MVSDCLYLAPIPRYGRRKCDYVIAKKPQFQIFLTSDKVAFCRAWAPYHSAKHNLNRFLNKKLGRPGITPEIVVFTEGPCLGPPSGGRVYASTPILSPDCDFGTSCLLHCGRLTASANSEDSWKRYCLSRTIGCGARIFYYLDGGAHFQWLLLLDAGYKYSYLLTY